MTSFAQKNSVDFIVEINHSNKRSVFETPQFG
jgi:hypothetical protein